MDSNDFYELEHEILDLFEASIDEKRARHKEIIKAWQGTPKKSTYQTIINSEINSECCYRYHWV
mgnify:CR=1 FL=1